MSARTSFGLCLAISALPLIPTALGFYHFLIVSTSNPDHPPIADLCLIAYRRSIDAAGHVALVIVAVLLLFALARWTVVLWRGLRETRQVIGLEPLAAPSHESARVQALPIDHRYKAMVRLIDADEPFALTVGYLSPRVLVSTGLLKTLNDVELEAVLRHEAAHVGRRDPLRLLLSDCCRRALPFIPAVSYLAHGFRTKKEMEADATAIASMGSPLPLASALAKILAAMPAQTSVGVGLSPTEARIDALLGRPLLEASKRATFVAVIASAPAMALLSLVLYLLASSPHLTPMHICPV